MKKAIILLLVLNCTNIFAQTDKQFYISSNTGYNIGTGNSNIGAVLNLQVINASTTSATDGTQEIPKINLGEGFNFGLNFGYMMNKNIGFELGGNYLMGSTTNTTNSSYTGEYKNNQIDATMIQLKPSMVFRGGYEKFNPYAKLGMIIGLGKINLETQYKQASDVFTSTLELSEGTSIGFQGSLGTLYKINDKFSLFGELSLISLEYAPNKGKYTKFTSNGTDVLPSLSVENKEFEFVNILTNSSVTPSANQPSKVPETTFSFNSFGLNFGVQYQF